MTSFVHNLFFLSELISCFTLSMISCTELILLSASQLCLPGKPLQEVKRMRAEKTVRYML